MGEDHFTPDRYVWSRAVGSSLEEPETAAELKRHAELTALREEARETRVRMREVIDFDSLPPATLVFDDLWKKLLSLVPDDASITPEDFAKAVLGDRAMFISGEREQLAARTGKLSNEEIQSVIETTQKGQIADEQSYSVEAVAWFSQRLASGQIRTRHDVDDWNRAFHQTTDKHGIQLVVDSLPDHFGAALRDSSFTRISSAIQPTATASAYKWFQWGYDLDSKLARYHEAETAYREAIARAPDAYSCTHLGLLLHHRAKRYPDAEAAYRTAISYDSTQPIVWNCLGNLLQTLERFAEAEAAYLTAISLDPKDALPWSGLGNLYCDHLDRLCDAADAYANALLIEPTNEAAQQNRLFLRRDFMGEGGEAKPLMAELLAIPNHEGPDTTHLHEAIFAAYDSNWGLASEALAKALTIRTGGFSWTNTDDWLRASAVLVHLNYGAELVAFLDERGDTARLRPWVEAMRAHQIGDRRALQNIAPEISTAAEVFYDGIQTRLEKLPEKTRRRPTPQPKRARRSKGSTR